jgi:hypothetical protein
MEKNLRVIAALVMVFSLSSLVSAQENKVDLSGNWVFTVQSEAVTA